MKKIDITFQNYKLLKDRHFATDDNIIVMEGANEKGKTTAITGFIEALEAKMRTIEPVTTGEKKGKNTFVFPDKDGNRLTVRVGFTNSSAKFTALDSSGKPITSVKKIREIAGEYKDITLEDVWQMVKTKPGRRQFLEEFILPRMDRESSERLKEIDSKVNSKDGTLFKERSDAKSVYEDYKRVIDKSKLSEEEEVKIARYDQAKAKVDKLQTEVDGYDKKSNENAMIEDKMRSIKGYIGAIRDSLSFLGTNTLEEVNRGLEQPYNTLSSKLHKLGDISKTKERLEKGEQYLGALDELKVRKDTYEKNVRYMEEKWSLYKDLDSEIGQLREEKEKIYQTADLPIDFGVEEDYFTVNGYPLDESQISESKAKLFLADLLFSVLESRFIRMGNIGAFGSDRLKELDKIAEKYGKHVFVEKVNEEIDDVVMTGIIEES